MFKKFTSMLGIAAIALMLVPTTAFAADEAKEGLISNLDATQPFVPSEGDVLSVSFEYGDAYSTPISQSSGSINIVKNGTVVKTLSSWTEGSTMPPRYTPVLTWNGRDIGGSGKAICGISHDICPIGEYDLVFDISANSGQVDGTGNAIYYTDTDTFTFTLSESSDSVSISTFTISDTNIDPAPSGGNDDLGINYTLSNAADTVTVDIKNADDQTVKTFTASASQKTTGAFSWDGLVSGDLAEPGTYNAVLTAKKAGFSDVVSTKTFSVAYTSSNRATVQNFSVTPTTFDPDVATATITFENNVAADTTVEIRKQDGTVVRTFSSYDGDAYSAGTTHAISWDGRSSAGAKVTNGTYDVVVVVRDNYGVSVSTDSILVDDTAGVTYSSSNAHISGIDFDPKSTFEPAKDDELQVEYDVDTDLDELVIYAVRGDQKIELDSDTNVDKDNNYEMDPWTGEDDDDEYVEAGDWWIVFESTIDNTTLTAGKKIKVEYDEPKIDEFLFSKDDFDPSIGEFTYVLFKIDSDASIDLEAWEDGDEDDTFEEDFEVNEDEWYAVEWDGSGFDEDTDKPEVNLIARNLVNEDIEVDEQLRIKIDEDTVSGSKANVTMDRVEPVISEPGDELTISYELDSEAEVVVSIYDNENASGSAIIELVGGIDQEEGYHELVWNGRKSNGSKLSKGIYSYKITARTSSTETEEGVFIIGDYGDAYDSGDDDDEGGISSNVTSVNGGSTGSSSDCDSQFPDIVDGSEFCAAANWARSEGIFEGYQDGTFKPYQAINRAETLKVLMEFVGIGPNYSATGDLGFSDVESGAWYISYISSAMSLGIFQGDSGSNTARPADTVNRAELIKLVFESLRASQGFQLSGTCGDGYNDVDTGVWFYGYACTASKYELFGTSWLLPSKLSTRGEVAEALYQLHLEGVI